MKMISLIAKIITKLQEKGLKMKKKQRSQERMIDRD